MGHSKLPWKIEGQQILGNEKNGHICTWSGRSADANLIITAVNVMPEVRRTVKGLLQFIESFPTEVDSVDAELSGYIKRGHDLLKKLEAVDG